MSCRPEIDPSKLLAGLYSAAAREYAELWAPVLQPTGERLIAAMTLGGATTVLDLGAGTGALLEAAGLTVSRVWMERPERRWTGAELLELGSRYGAPSRRLATLPPASRRECLARVGAALAALPAEALVYRPEMLLAVAARA